MKLKVLLTHLLKKDTPDEEERADAPQKVQATPVGIDAGGGTTDEDDVDLEQDDDQEYDDALPNVDLDNQPNASPRGLRRTFSGILSSIFPSPSDEEEIQAYIPHYRVLPILSGITIPFCILLEIPGLTADWYIRTDGSTIVASKPNPPLLDVGIALSISCAVLANICLVIRFLERRIKTMTILCTLFLSIHGKLTVTFPTS
jgi:potassium channel subfamily K